MNEDLNNIRLPRTKESTLFEVVLACIIIIEGVFIYLKSAGDSGTLTIAAIPLLAAVALMVAAYRLHVSLPLSLLCFLPSLQILNG